MARQDLTSQDILQFFKIHRKLIRAGISVIDYTPVDVELRFPDGALMWFNDKTASEVLLEELCGDEEAA